VSLAFGCGVRSGIERRKRDGKLPGEESYKLLKGAHGDNVSTATVGVMLRVIIIISKHTVRPSEVKEKEVCCNHHFPRLGLIDQPDSFARKSSCYWKRYRLQGSGRFATRKGFL
jgi:hypothetical protein